MNYIRQHEVQFGVFSGQTFVWLLNNALGYGGFIVDKLINVEKERVNQFLFKRYMEKFEEGMEAFQMKQKEREKLPLQSLQQVYHSF